MNLAISRGDRREKGQALMNLGFAYFDLGNLETAYQSLQKALKITINLGDKLTQSLVMGGIADIYIDRNKTRTAIKTLNEAIEILQESYDVGTELRLLQSLGNAYTASDDYQNALDSCLRLYTLAESVGAKSSMCSALANQISIHRHLGNLSKVFELGEAGLDLAKEIQSLPEEAFIRWQIGMGYEACDETEKAKVEMKQAIDIEAQINSLQLEKHQEYFQKFEAGN